jgi:hypothetical protein
MFLILQGCIYFDLLPKETQDLILTFLDDKARRLLRSTNVYWFTKIYYSHFTIYFAHSAMLPDLIQTFQRYSKPIGLRFEKTKEFGPSYTTLGVLTNLTALEVDPERYVEPNFVNFNAIELYRFTTLTNLQRFSFNYLGVNEHTQHFPNLTYLEAWPLTPDERMNHLKGLLNLQHLNYMMRVLDDDDLIARLDNPAALTALNITGAADLLQVDSATVAKLSNLSKLSFESRETLFPFSQLPQLEWLDVFASQFDDFSLVPNLTFLKISTGRNSRPHDFQQLAALTNLRSLSVRLPITDQHYSFLSKMTNLERMEAFTSTPDATLTGEFMKFINSSKLTSILCYSATILYASHLTNLVHCTFRAPQEFEYNFQLSQVTNLQSHPLISARCFPNVKHWMVYLHPTSPLLTISALTSLQHLESINLPVINADTQRILGRVTRLTELRVSYSSAFEYNFEVLQSLTALKVLQLQKRSNEPIAFTGLPQALLKLPNLESLRLLGMVNDHVLTVVVGMTNLTELWLDGPQTNGIDERIFSRLTNLHCLSLSQEGQSNWHQLNLPFLYDFKRK